MTRRLVRAGLFAAVLAGVVAAAGCSNSNPPSTTSPTPTPTGPTTATFSSFVYPSAIGAAWQNLTISGTGGTVTATLVSTNPPGVTLGLGIGVAGVVNGCPQGISINATSGAQVAASVGAGSYCVKVFDPGTLTSKVEFTVSIVHP